jgi:MFS family permease
LSWYVAGYSLTVGTFILIAGRLGDMYGHKNIFTGGWLWFALWSLLACVSYYYNFQIFFIIYRTLQGSGPVFLIPNGLAILGRTYPEGEEEKHRIQRIWRNGSR